MSERIHYDDNGEPLCGRVPTFAKKTDAGVNVTCKRCQKLLAEVLAVVGVPSDGR